MTMIHVFVYGTLKSGLYYNRLMTEGEATSLGPAKLESGDFVLVFGSSFPYAVPFRPEQKERLWDKGIQTTIIGELFEAPDTILTRLDRLEGYPHHYNRAEVKVSTASCEGITRNAYMYHRNEFLNSNDVVCTDGVWWPHVNTTALKGKQRKAAGA